MKSKLSAYLDKHFKDIENLCKFLYDNPEGSFKEKDSSKYIQDILSKNKFNVSSDYLEVPNSFYAIKGDGYPRICYLCEYDAIEGMGHLTGHNALSAISLGAALSLGDIINETKGSVIVIGCPGEYLGGTKLAFAKQGVFDDIDLVMECHPYIKTAESGTSSSIIPLQVNFKGNSGLSFLSKEKLTSLDCVLMTFNILSLLQKSFPKEVELNYILSKGGNTPLLTPVESEAKFYIRSPQYDIGDLVNNKIREVIKYVSDLTHIPSTISLYETSNEELLTNTTLSRLFMHNLKETGIINSEGPLDILAGLSIGAVSKKVPTIHPYISITENNDVKYGTEEFMRCTISPFSFKQIYKSALSLAYTAVDIIEKDELLTEIKEEFYKK